MRVWARKIFAHTDVWLVVRRCEMRDQTVYHHSNPSFNWFATWTMITRLGENRPSLGYYFGHQLFDSLSASFQTVSLFWNNNISPSDKCTSQLFCCTKWRALFADISPHNVALGALCFRISRRWRSWKLKLTKRGRNEWRRRRRRRRSWGQKQVRAVKEGGLLDRVKRGVGVAKVSSWFRCVFDVKRDLLFVALFFSSLLFVVCCFCAGRILCPPAGSSTLLPTTTYSCC